MKRGILLCFMCCLFHIMVAQTFSEADQLILEGAKLHDEQKYEAAIQKYQKALQLNPNSISALYEIALSYLQMQDYDNAVKYSSQVIKLGYKPMLIDAYTVKGTALANSNKLEEAIKMFQGAIAEQGDNYLLDYNLGLAYYNQGDKKSAFIYIRKAINADPTHADAFLIYAYVLSDLDMWIQSVYAYQFFLLQEPNTERSTKAFKQMMKLLKAVTFENINPSDAKLGLEPLYKNLEKLKSDATNSQSEYLYFSQASFLIFENMKSVGTSDSVTKKGLFWDFFVPIFSELMASGHFDTYTRYISACYFPESANWWEKHEAEVHDFKLWFEQGVEDDFVEEDADSVFLNSEDEESEMNQ